MSSKAPHLPPGRGQKGRALTTLPHLKGAGASRPSKGEGRRDRSELVVG